MSCKQCSMLFHLIHPSHSVFSLRFNVQTLVFQY